jgi:hypothetical protein
MYTMSESRDSAPSARLERGESCCPHARLSLAPADFRLSATAARLLIGQGVVGREGRGGDKGEEEGKEREDGVRGLQSCRIFWTLVGNDRYRLLGPLGSFLFIQRPHLLPLTSDL